MSVEKIFNIGDDALSNLFVHKFGIPIIKSESTSTFVFIFKASNNLVQTSVIVAVESNTKSGQLDSSKSTKNSYPDIINIRFDE